MSSVFNQLVVIRNRYFRPVIAHPEGHLGHHGDCHVFLPIELYRYAPCTCGLNHDLRPLGHEIAMKLNPNFGNELRLQEVGVYFSKFSAEENLAIMKMLFDTFGECDPRTEEDDEDDWDQIILVFGREYVDKLRSQIHNTTCPVCGWTWHGNKNKLCSYCKSLKAYRDEVSSESTLI